MKQRTQLLLAVAGLIALHAVMLLAGPIAPYDYAVQDRDQSYAPPTRIHFIDERGTFHPRPFVYVLHDRVAGHRKEQTRMYPVRFVVHGANYRVAGFWSGTTHLFGVDEPAKIFLLGTDQYGRDQLSRLLHGGQISLLAGFLAAALSTGIGMLFGIMAGYYGRLADEFVMRVAELFMVLPWLYLLLGIKAFLPLNVSPVRSFLLVVAVIGVVGWARPARLIRGVVLTAKERNYVLAARGFGASDIYLLRRHILPQISAVVLTQATLLVPRYSLSEMTLSFLGLGVTEPLPSWGNMLASLQHYYVLTSYWWMFLPAIPVIMVFWGYYTAAHTLQRPVSL